ncbi:hypothetical protein [Couchioplanes caeruleus]|uniref:Uncharacterized protein n=2 Tax=Couchioplanes caeruleus TaxID=56438 RepID=A0A1K0GUL8_9ACTN|nr:hypothetical protein [Couchioplanes caeruleus]OJF16206.1 hypothetical protein BG844_00195 [Couchioplanes caeruleus subsp. caeruleus]ROP28754.1 hypothetical protein EDD30_1526 [Couchioplanes caeruleus]
MRPAHDVEEATAAGLYGIIVSAAVMAASHAPTAGATVVTVVVTLTVYWAAERYARILAERIHAGHRPRWDTIRRQMTTGWEMITASLLPLGVLVVVWLTRRDLRTAVVSALVCSTVLLCLAGWRIGRQGRLSTREQLVCTVVAGLFGVAMIVLKALLH